ncbi:ABC transporter C family member 10 [Bienertia sinuspersici]
MLLQGVLSYSLVCKFMSKKVDVPAHNRPLLFIQKLSVAFNAYCLRLSDMVVVCSSNSQRRVFPKSSIANLELTMNDEDNNSLAKQITPLSKAEVFSEMSFCWLNPLMILDKKKCLEEHDLLKLRDIDTARFCYLQFLNQINKHEQGQSLSESMILWTIVG